MFGHESVDDEAVRGGVVWCGSRPVVPEAFDVLGLIVELLGRVRWVGVVAGYYLGPHTNMQHLQK